MPDDACAATNSSKNNNISKNNNSDCECKCKEGAPEAVCRY